MNCERARQVEMDDDLRPVLLRELLRHQQECAECRRLAEEQGRLLQVLDAWQLDPGFGAGFEERLEKRILNLQRERPDWRSALGAWHTGAARWLRPLYAPLAGAAVAAALLLTAGSLFRTPSAPTPPPTVASAQPDTLVRDLQALDRDSDLLANFDFLNASGGANTVPLSHSEKD